MRKKKKKSPVVPILIVAVLVAVVGIIVWFVDRRIPGKETMDLNKYYNVKDENSFAIITESTVSTTNGLLIDGKPYLPYSVVSAEINPRFYYSKTESRLFVTTPTEKTSLDLSGGDAESDAVFVDGELYISLDYLKLWSDIRVQNYSGPERYVFFNNWDHNVTQVVSDSAEIRFEPEIKSAILKKVSKGDRLIVDDDDDTDMDDETKALWSRVVSEDGIAGYIMDDALGGISSERESHDSGKFTYTTLADGESVNMVFHQTTSYAANNALPQMTANMTGVDVIAPTWFFLDSKNGDVKSLADTTYVANAKKLGLDVWAVFNDFDGSVNDSNATAQALSLEVNREKMITTIVSETLRAGARGINLDFEKVAANAAADYLEFIRELSIECRLNNLILSVDNYVPDFTGYLDRGEQALVADYVIVMCYDEHTNGSEEAGSVASLTFLQNGVRDTLKEVPAEKLIVAIPFFTRLWATTENTSPTSSAVGMQEAMNYVSEHGLTPEWNEACGQNYAEYTEGSVRYQVWLEDNASVEAKMNAITEAGCIGVAEWKLGLETDSVWSVIETGLKQ